MGQGTSARIESAEATVLAHIRPHGGAKADPAWSHKLTRPDGDPIGTLTLMRAASGRSLQEFAYWNRHRGHERGRPQGSLGRRLESARRSSSRRRPMKR